MLVCPCLVGELQSVASEGKTAGGDIINAPKKGELRKRRKLDRAGTHQSLLWAAEISAEALPRVFLQV